MLECRCSYILLKCSKSFAWSNVLWNILTLITFYYKKFTFLLKLLKLSKLTNLSKLLTLHYLKSKIDISNKILSFSKFPTRFIYLILLMMTMIVAINYLKRICKDFCIRSFSKFLYKKILTCLFKLKHLVY